MTLQEAKQLALQNFKTKNYVQAIKIYEEILKYEKTAQIFCDLGALHRICKNYDLAIKCYQHAVKVDPKYAPTYNNFGNLLKELKKYKDAIYVYSVGIKENPNDANLYNNLGMAYDHLNDNNRAIEAYKMAVKLNPKFTKAINNIGVVLYKQKRYEESAKVFQIALNVDPDYNEVYSNMGAALNKAKQYDESIIALQTAIKKMPKHGGAYTNLGNVYNKLHDYKMAAKMHETSIKLDPQGSNAYSNLATSYKYLGKHAKSAEMLKKAIELDPNFENAHFDLATNFLAHEDFENGWREYEWRYKKDEMKSHLVKYKDIFSKPMFNGTQNIKEQKILVHSEQGYGDSIQFIRFAKLLKDKGAIVVLYVREGLKELFSNLDFVDEVYDREDLLPSFDLHISIMSLPFIFGMKTTKDVPSVYPYLAKDEKYEVDVARDAKKINIGLVWSASATGESYDGKVFGLDNLAPIINCPDIKVFSLQVGDGSEEIEKYGDKITDLAPSLKNFAYTADAISKMDLIISSDTSVAHLAGAMGANVWVLLQKYPDWRWTYKGDKIHWYPSAKLFRQKTNRVWDNVFQSVFDKLSSSYKIRVK